MSSMEQQSAGDSSLATTPSCPSYELGRLPTPGLGKTLSQLRPVEEEAEVFVENPKSGTLRVISLNLGGRNTNPVEFELKGDNSEMAVEAVKILRRAGKALKSAEEGPLLMPPSELKLIEETLLEIFGNVETAWSSRVRSLLRCETWGDVLSLVRVTNPHFFNSLNLYTLKLNRPSVWENPASCRDFTSTEEFLAGWKQWYLGLDRNSSFWVEDAPRVAKKRSLDVPAAFAGLLLFDVMCLCSARCSCSSASDDMVEDAREVPFQELARFAAKLPASSLTARHAAAKRVTAGSHALLAQEARSFAQHPTIAEEFLPPFNASDGFTAVFLRKESFNNAVNISTDVAKRMEEFIDGEVPEDAQKAWRTSVSRLAAVSCECRASLGGFRVCFVSLHVSKSDNTAAFIEALRGVLADYDADINILGMDSNCSGAEAPAFQKRLSSAGFEVGCTVKQEQVTVAKARTAFQTQLQKVGEVDVSHKDYIVSWTSSSVCRLATTYTPDLRTCYGVEQETKQCMRLPTTKWPFDHCAVATSFRRKLGCKDNLRCSPRFFCKCVLVMLVLALFMSPLASGHRKSPFGSPGGWFMVQWFYTPRVGICEVAAPCPQDWVQYHGSCYLQTPKMTYPDLQRYCEELGSLPTAINSEEENELVLQQLCPKGSFCFIGLHSDYTGRKYWLSGEEYGFTRLANQEAPGGPLFEDSRSVDYLATVMGNLPGEVSGCVWGWSQDFGNTSGPTQTIRDFALPTLAITLCLVLLLQPRPSNQRLASSLLWMGFVIKITWILPNLLNACFVDDYSTMLGLHGFFRNAEAGGHTVTSLLSLWMIVRRMAVLYGGRTLKTIYYALLLAFFAMCLIATVFIDGGAPMRLSGTVIALLIVNALIVTSYLTVSILIPKDLYRTWAFLHREATNGCNENWAATARSVRAARLHFFVVLLTILTGAVRWAALTWAILNLLFFLDTDIAHGGMYAWCSLFDAVTNDVCAHMMAVMNMDAAVVRAKGISAEAAERAEREVEQHQLAMRMLQAAPTSREQLRQLAALENKARGVLGTEEEKQAFLILQSAIRVETARIHKLMYCVRVRAMTMRMRYQYLTEVPALEGHPRQHVPERFYSGGESEAAAAKYINWLYDEANGAQQVFFRQLTQLLGTFNSASLPSELGLAQEELPWRLWVHGSDQAPAMKRLPKGEVIRPGDILIHCPAKTCCFDRSSALCIALEEMAPDQVLIHRWGMEEPQEVPRSELRTRDGGGVFIPGPQKKKQRCLDKVQADYSDSVEWPPAANVVDICRCMVLLDDPYAMAAFVAYLRKNMKVVRLKNRFSEDVLESHGPEDLQTLFQTASEATPSETGCSTQVGGGMYRQYRDISINVELKTPNGVPFVAEIQVTLTNLAILKHADTKLYTLRRMKSPSELSKVHVFSEEVTEGAAV